MEDELGGGGKSVRKYTKSAWISLCSYGGTETLRDVNHSRGMRFSFKVFMPVIFPF